MSRYKISVTPLGKFFFGGDMTFKVEGKKEYNERYGSYIIHSGQFPQQTSLLGMMRYLLLSNQAEAFDRLRNKIISAQAAGTLIGERGFTITPDYGENDYGVIRRLSSCFLEGESGGAWRPLLPAPKDYGYDVMFGESLQTQFNGRDVPSPVLRGYSPKASWEPLYLDGQTAVPASCLFVEDARIGIDKKYDGRIDQNDGSFYKQIFYRLGNKEWSGKIRYAFYVEVDDTVDLTTAPYQHALVTLGGDGSRFVLEATACPSEEDDAAYTEIYNPSARFDAAYKVVLLSDSYLSRQEVTSCVSFALSGVKPFRFLRTTVRTEDYTILSPSNLRSGKYYLYEKGSVFYCSEEQVEAFRKALDKPCFRQIGYNAYQVFSNKSNN